VNLASVLEVMMAAALATLHPLPPSELAALVLVVSEATTDGNGKTTMIVQEQTVVGTLEQLGCWLTPACQAWQAAKFLHHFVVCPLVGALSVKQENGLDVPPVRHWRAEFCTHVLMLVLSHFVTLRFAVEALPSATLELWFPDPQVTSLTFLSCDRQQL